MTLEQPSHLEIPESWHFCAISGLDLPFCMRLSQLFLVCGCTVMTDLGKGTMQLIRRNDHPHHEYDPKLFKQGIVEIQNKFPEAEIVF